MKDDFGSLYKFNRWADRHVLDTCRKLTTEQYAAEPIPGWSSVRSSVVHIAVVTDGWLRGLTGESVDVSPTEEEMPTVDDAARLLDRADRTFHDLLPTLTPEQLVTPRTLSRRGRSVSLPPWAVLRHLVNHASYHRGQVASKLKRFGVEQPATDFIYWVFEHGDAAGVKVRWSADAPLLIRWFRRTRARRPGWLGCALGAVLIQMTLALLLHGARLRKGTEDTDLYYRYATWTLQGKVPYRDFPVEYPPLAIPLFVAPRFVARDVESFKTAFAFEMLLFHAGTVLFVAGAVARSGHTGRLPARLAWYTLVFLTLSRLLVTRYDAAPAFLGFAASVLWFSGRGSTGGLAASLGALSKVFPALVAVIAVPWDLSRPGPGRGRGTVAFASTAALGLAAWVGFAGTGGVSGSLRYHLGRGLEYGSLYSGAQMLAAKVLGLSLVISRDHASFSTVTPWSPALLGLVPPIQGAAVLVVAWTFVRRGMRDGVRYSGAAVLAFVVTGKVFSPQYLLWLLPYLAALEGPVARRCRWLFAAVCAATLLAPSALGRFPRTSLWVILAYDFRNLLVVVLLSVLVFGPPEGAEG